MALSDLAVRQAKATGKSYTLGDIDGLCLNVSPKGGKCWHFRYPWAGKQKRISFGTYPEVSLREARSLRDEARALLAKGINPKVHRKQKRQAVRLAAVNTFKAVYLLWLEHRKQELKDGRQSTLSQIQRIFKKDVLPRLGDWAIYDIRRPDLLEVLAKIEQRKAFTTAEKVRTWFRQLFRFALVKIDGLENNPASDLDVVAAAKPLVVHNPFLRLPDLPEFLCKLRGYGGRATTLLGIRLLLLTGVRTGELRLATPDQFDLERGLWIIPPEVVKQLKDGMRKRGKRPQDIPPYIVPLSVQAIEIARYLLAQVKPAQRYLLPHRSDLKQCISENTLNAALKRMGYEGLLTGHGIRGTMSTALNEIGYPKVWVDAQLSHADPNKVSASYNHAMYVEPRRRMMQDWADRLDLLEQGQVAAASAHLTVRAEGVSVAAEDAMNVMPAFPEPVVDVSAAGAVPPVVVLSSPQGEGFLRLSPLPSRQTPEPAAEPIISDIQRERQEMLALYEAPCNLPVPVFARLAGKSRDQINREIKAGKLLALSLGNRGHRVPDWQLNPQKCRLARSVLEQMGEEDPWRQYRALSQPRELLQGRSAIEVLSSASFQEVVEAISRDLVMGATSQSVSNRPPVLRQISGGSRYL